MKTECSRRSHASLAALLLLLGSAVLVPLPSRGEAAKPGCEKFDLTPEGLTPVINKFGKQDFENPPKLTVQPTSPATRLDLVVDYKDVTILGCRAHLRTYNGAIVGPTIRAKPGDTIHIRLINNLPPPKPGQYPEHPQQPEPAGHGGHTGQFNFNITNLHTHGLHVAPQGEPDSSGKVPYESDNVLLEIQPGGGQQDYRFHIHPDHPAGTFWYHAHVHGATAIQVSSGMAGALIIEGGTKDNGDLETVPIIGRVKGNEKIFVLQQITYDETGVLEKFVFSPDRPTLINGQLVPVIRMQPGEVQRWRFIHGGVQENVALALDGHPIHEVAADGMTLGRSVPWAEAPPSHAQAPNTLFLIPGYRSDVLVQARQPEPGRRYFLRKLNLQPVVSIQAQERALARAFAGVPEAEALGTPPVTPADFAPGQILAELVIEGDAITDQSLPTAAELAGLIPKDLKDITPTEIGGRKEPVELKAQNAICNATDGECSLCTGGPPCRRSFQVNKRQFSLTPKYPRVLKLNTAAEWIITTNINTFHPFHIHTNPFQVDRMEPDTTGALVRRTVWKDTIMAQGTNLPPLRMRYARFTGKFVLHCHILQHEDQGMMELVQITN